MEAGQCPRRSTCSAPGIHLRMRARLGVLRSLHTISGLPQFLDYLLPKYPDHELAKPGLRRNKRPCHSAGSPKKATCSRSKFRHPGQGARTPCRQPLDRLRRGVCRDRRRANRPAFHHEEFRARYLGGIHAAAEPWLYPLQRRTIKIVPATLGELSQAIGAALVALYSSRK